MAREVSRRLADLDAKVKRDKVGNVIGQFDGVGEPIMLNAHLDTVEPGRGIKPKVKGDKIVSDGTTILGVDCKAGVSAILEALASMKEARMPHLPVEILFTVAEESLLLGSKKLNPKDLRARRGLTFDAGTEANEVCISSPYYHSMDVTIKGRSAHAGHEPEKGISAIRIASEIIVGLRLGRIDKETTANVGVIKGGAVRNAVPENASFVGEIRSRNEQKLIKMTQAWQEVVQRVQRKYPKAKIALKIARDFDGYVFNKSHPLLVLVTRALKKMGLTPKLIHSGGGTDVNAFNTKGIMAIGVGAASWEPHTTREYTKISEMVKVAKFAEAIMRDV